MGLAKHALYFAAHPVQLFKIIQWRLSYTPLHRRDKLNESDTTKLCYEFLEKTSRSFSPVIQALHPELRMTICMFYLVLRGLDTIEDDPSLPFSTKEPLLRNFHTFIEKDGWTYDGNRPEEKHREVLVQFDKVIIEYKKLKPAYRAIIKDITRQMGHGMADFIEKAESEDVAIQTVEEYDLYCWYVAGVVGEGLTRLIVEAKMGDPILEEKKHLYKSMGLYLQKNNVLRDIHDDFGDDRRWWPKEIWSKYVDNFEDLLKPQNIDAALSCSSEMVLNALKHTCDCIFYLERVHEQSLFEFAAIPQTMALATYEMCFRNPDIFQKNVKITKGDAFELIIESTQGIDGVCSVFHRYAQRIQQKNQPSDPNYSAINAECEKIKKFAETVANKHGGKALATQQDSSSFLTPVLGIAVASIIVLAISWMLKSINAAF